MRNIFKVLEQIKEVLGEDNEYSEMKCGIDDLKYALRYKAPEDRWNFVYDKVLSIRTTKSIKELKED